MTPTIGDLVEFIIKNRTERCFQYSVDHIKWMIMKSASEEAMIYASNKEEKVCGIVIASINHLSKELTIHDILTTERFALPQFIHYFMWKYRGYSLSEIKNGIRKAINTDKLCRRLTRHLH